MKFKKRGKKKGTVAIVLKPRDIFTKARDGLLMLTSIHSISVLQSNVHHFFDIVSTIR